MKFEKEFPSLQQTNWFEMIDNKELDNIIHLIEDNCLDKQLLKEKILNLNINLPLTIVKPEEGFLEVDNSRLIPDLLKELGLEEKQDGYQL